LSSPGSGGSLGLGKGVDKTGRAALGEIVPLYSFKAKGVAGWQLACLPAWND